MSKLKPIDTAPKDGTCLALFIVENGKTRSSGAGSYVDGAWRGGLWSNKQPTHWTSVVDYCDGDTEALDAYRSLEYITRAQYTDEIDRIRRERAQLRQEIEDIRLAAREARS